MEEVFWRLDDYGLVVNADKCSFGRAEVSFLGRMVNDPTACFIMQKSAIACARQRVSSNRIEERKGPVPH